VSVRAWLLCLLLAVGGIAAGQEAQEETPQEEAPQEETPQAPAAPPEASPAQPGSATDKAAHALMQDTLLQAERWLLEMFVQPGTDVPTIVLQDFEKLDTAMQESYFRDLAQRSGMLVFVTREEVRLVQERRKATENAQRLLFESRMDRRRERKRRATVTVFWASLGTALAGFAGSYGCWYLSQHLDQVYQSATIEKAPLLKAWSELLQNVSYASAGVGAVGVTIALPALAKMRQR
jgi:hypothetical protein